MVWITSRSFRWLGPGSPGRVKFAGKVLVSHTVNSSGNNAEPKASARPNVVVVLIDDMGFGASSAFGGPCRMPTADRLADSGLRFTRFHTTGVCSPTRAALLTGRNHHAVGMGHIAELATEHPANTARIPRSAASIARVLKDAGFATGHFGKSHEMSRSLASPAGPYDAWPTGQMGFEKFYGFFGGATNHWYPNLVDGTTFVSQEKSPEEGYHFSEDMVDKAISWVHDVRTMRPGDPFFCYLSFGATHAPFHVDPAWAEKYRGEFDAGWDALREATLRRQREAGLVPVETELAPWMPGVDHWDELSEDEQQAAAVLMELYAGFAEHTDAQVGRFVAALDDLGIEDDTLILYVLGDNGASAEGGPQGQLIDHVGAIGRESAADMVANRDIAGSPETWAHYPAGWAFAMDTPYPWVKQVASHFGATRNGLIARWPKGIDPASGGLRHQFHHVVDVMPTILEVTGTQLPDHVDGVEQQPLAGRSMVDSFTNPSGEGERGRTQYFEIHGNRAIYRDGWVACALHRGAPWDMVTEVGHTLAADRWELYDTTTDWSQTKDLAASHPELLAELKELFLVEAGRNGALPLDVRTPAARKNSATAAVTSRVFHANARRIPHEAVPNVLGKSHAVTAFLSLDTDSANGVICSQGGRIGGWSLYVKDGILSYCHSLGVRSRQFVRAEARATGGRHDVRLEFDYAGDRPGLGGTVTLLLDGEVVGTGAVERTVAFIFPGTEDFNVGIDPLTPVSDEYPVFTNELEGQIEWVRVEVAPGDAHPEAVLGRANAQMAAQ